jgi:hypothetical protein
LAEGADVRAEGVADGSEGEPLLRPQPQPEVNSAMAAPSAKPKD